MENNILLTICLGSYYPEKNNRIELLQFLINYGIDIKANNNLAIRHACNTHYTEIIKILIENGADIHVDDDYPLRISISNYLYDNVDLLLQAGANINVAEGYALRKAVSRYDYTFIKLFLENGADIGWLRWDDLISGIEKSIESDEPLETLDLLASYGVNFSIMNKNIDDKKSRQIDQTINTIETYGVDLKIFLRNMLWARLQ